MGFDVDAMAATIMAKTSPERRDDEAKATRLESIAAADAARRKVWGSMALQVLEDAASKGQAWACEALDEISRRVSK